MVPSATATRTIPFGCPIIGEAEKRAVMEVLDGPLLTHGPRVKEFEARFAEFIGSEHAVATASCTAALHMAYLCLGIGPGNEVIVPAQTHVATAHAVELCGARCVFVDSERRTGNIDIDLLEAAITERTRAVSVVHYLGMPVDMQRVLEITRSRGLFIVEDCALAIGTTFKGVHAGLHGDVGCFSFYPVKHMTTAEGGMLITRREDIAREVSRLRAFGIDRNVVSERAVPGMYDVQALGFNYRLSEIGAALGLAQIERLPEFLRRRAENYTALTAGLRQLNGITLLQSSQGVFLSSHYCHVMILDDVLAARRVDVMQRLRKRGVGTSVYYPRPVPLMSYYQRKYGYSNDDFPVASWISDHSIALPVGPHVSLDDVEHMLCVITETLQEAG